MAEQPVLGRCLFSLRPRGGLGQNGCYSQWQSARLAIRHFLRHEENELTIGVKNLLILGFNSRGDKGCILAIVWSILRP
jgi:hypothetical protein